jgi:hypothetical protein
MYRSDIGHEALDEHSVNPVLTHPFEMTEHGFAIVG